MRPSADQFSGKQIFGVGSLAVMFLAGLVALGAWGCPHYRVWEQSMEGEAEFSRAEQNKKITVEESRAKLESAKMLADAEIERAKGVAEANRIIGDSLQGNDAYLRYLWIQGLNDGTSEVIYIPTEANLPILEAGRLKSDK